MAMHGAQTADCQGSPSPLAMGDMQHPPYSFDMSPCDYDLFAKMKELLRWARYNKKRDYSCCRAVTAGHQHKWTR
jgi:hypothetical protein